MSLTQKHIAQISVAVENEGVTLHRVRERSLAEIERLENFHGNGKLPLAELKYTAWKRRR
jgi:hypothetical protein